MEVTGLEFANKRVVKNVLEQEDIDAGAEDVLQRQQVIILSKKYAAL